MPLGLTDLTRSASRGCSDPDCTHDHDHGPLYLHGRCHPHAPVGAEYDAAQGTMTISCNACLRPVTSVWVAERPAALRACHPGGLEISFDRESGALRLACRKCHAALCTVAVSEADR